MHPQASTRIATEIHSTQLTRPKEGISSHTPTEENHQKDLTRRKEVHCVKLGVLQKGKWFNGCLIKTGIEYAW
ncbi:hypothetical protein F2Q68_00020393 [Brassica cretica]|uniref:Uncharacterized protein n=1 Tax=Brassica cretica TaxID=69181 RepID=A0A8S9G3I8_BRACR|nr:hypothetical protein F2Q68_00020393 [Brassica cretica]